ncbi:toll/interleukin-1 receptor domain-containing protein [Sphingopyxis sp. 550A]
MTTNLFISWSGKLSQAVAGVIHSWIPSVLQSVEPFLSSEDIEKGTRWSDHIAQKLEECGFGVIILTDENTLAPWVMFEAGALSKMVGKSNVAPVLLNIQPTNVRPPLSQFQSVRFEEKDILRLMKSINKSGDSPIREDALERTFSAMWPQFKQDVDNILTSFQGSSELDSLEEGKIDLDSLNLSVSELIKAVQVLQEDIRSKNNVDLNEELSRTLFDIRRSSMRNHIPRGAIEDLEKSLDIIEKSIKESGTSCISLDKEESEDVQMRIAKVTRFLSQEYRPRPRFSEIEAR